MGFSNPKTMKVEGKIEEQKVVVLIDCGANFISNETVAKLKIPVDKTEKYVIAMGTGMEVSGQGLCRNVKLQIQDIEICEEFLPLKLGKSDVILGMQWLVKLGLTHTNWATQTMKFQVDGEMVTLKGNPTLERSMVSLKAITKALKQEGHGIIIELGRLEKGTEPNQDITTFSEIIKQHEKVFQMRSFTS